MDSGGLEEYLEARNMSHFVSFTGGHRRNIFKTLGEYKAMLLNCVFSLCPGGNNAESHRLYEVLDAGSIPLVTRKDWSSGLQHIGPSPLLILESWNELGTLIREYVSQPRRLDEYQRQLAMWWRQRQEEASDLFRSALMGSPIAVRCQYDSCSEKHKATPSLKARTAAGRLWLVHPREGQLVPHLGALVVRVVSEGVDASHIEVHMDSTLVEQPCTELAESLERSRMPAVGASTISCVLKIDHVSSGKHFLRLSFRSSDGSVHSSAETAFEMMRSSAACAPPAAVAAEFVRVLNSYVKPLPLGDPARLMRAMEGWPGTTGRVHLESHELYGRIAEYSKVHTCFVDAQLTSIRIASHSHDMLQAAQLLGDVGEGEAMDERARRYKLHFALFHTDVERARAVASHGSTAAPVRHRLEHDAIERLESLQRRCSKPDATGDNASDCLATIDVLEFQALEETIHYCLHHAQFDGDYQVHVLERLGQILPHPTTTVFVGIGVRSRLFLVTVRELWPHARLHLLVPTLDHDGLPLDNLAGLNASTLRVQHHDLIAGSAAEYALKHNAKGHAWVSRQVRLDDFFAADSHSGRKRIGAMCLSAHELLEVHRCRSARMHDHRLAA
jgi:hypothetical protein